MAPEGTVIVTGANGTLGSEIVKRLVGTADWASRYYGVYTVRKVETADTLRGVLAGAAAAHHDHEAVALDLASLQSVRTVAAEINERVTEGQLPPIRALILNAAFQELTTQSFTTDGFDMTFQSNYLSQWLLTLLLLKSVDKEHGRIVFLGSWTHDTEDPRNKMGGLVDYYSQEKWKTLFHGTDTLAKGTFSSPADDPKATAGMRRYGASKLCDVMTVHELQERLSRDPELANISVLGVDPGGMPTTLVRRAGSWLYVTVLVFAVSVVATILSWLQPNGMLRPASKSARDVLRAALENEPSPLSEHPKGLYFNGDAIFTTGREARDPQKRGALWRDSIALTGLKASDTALKSLG